MFDRADKTLTVCEIKFADQPASVAVGREFQKKMGLFKANPKYRMEMALICAAGATEELKSGDFFDRILTLEDIVGG